MRTQFTSSSMLLVTFLLTACGGGGGGAGSAPAGLTPAPLSQTTTTFQAPTQQTAEPIAFPDGSTGYVFLSPATAPSGTPLQFTVRFVPPQTVAVSSRARRPRSAGSCVVAFMEITESVQAAVIPPNTMEYPSISIPAASIFSALGNFLASADTLTCLGVVGEAGLRAGIDAGTIGLDIIGSELPIGLFLKASCDISNACYQSTFAVAPLRNANVIFPAPLPAVTFAPPQNFYVVLTPEPAPPAQALLFDYFTGDSSLNSMLFAINGSAATAALTNFDANPTATIVTPSVTFSPSLGLGIGARAGRYQQGGIQSVQAFTPPFTVTAQGSASSIDAGVLQLAISTQDGGTGVGLDGGIGGLAATTGFNYTSPSGAGTHWDEKGQLSAAAPTLNQYYTLAIRVDASGAATASVSTGGSRLGAATISVGSGPFYVVLSEGSGAFSSGNGNQANWSSMSVTNP